MTATQHDPLTQLAATIEELETLHWAMELDGLTRARHLEALELRIDDLHTAFTQLAAEAALVQRFAP